VIGPDAGSGAAGSLYPALQLSAPQFSTRDADTNILFDQNPATSTYCTCRVTLDGLSVDFDNGGTGVPVTNLPSQVFSGTLFASLQIAGAGSGGSYNWNFPAGAGYVNQDLTTDGGGTNPMLWGAASRQVAAFTATSGTTLTAAGNLSVAYSLWDIERSGPTGNFTTPGIRPPTSKARSDRPTWPSASVMAW
jgi:hypothetical protein